MIQRDVHFVGVRQWCARLILGFRGLRTQGAAEPIVHSCLFST
jgi:hypothetical protein